LRDKVVRYDFGRGERWTIPFAALDPPLLVVKHKCKLSSRGGK
jgi:hypothetical protein